MGSIQTIPRCCRRALKKETVEIGHLPVPGKHNLHNLLAAIAVARHFKLSWEEIKQGISMLALPERRLQFVRQKGDPVFERLL